VGGDFQGLGIVRSLGRQGIPVCVMDDEHSIARFSRYTTSSLRTASLRDQRRCVEIVLETGRRLDFRGWLLFPSRDETVAAFSRYHAPLTKFFRVPTPKWNTTKWLWDKRNTYRLANELGIPTPLTWYPRDVAELDQIQADPPLAVKPAIKEHFVYATKAKAWRANNRIELRELFQRASALVRLGEVMIQDIIPGGGDRQFAYCAFFKEGRAVGSMVVRRTRQHPPEFGRASTFVETIESPILEAMSERFLRRLDYYGLVELEYKQDPRDGEFKLLDVNGRTWGYHTLGYRAGVDFVHMLYEDQTGQPVQSRRARPGVSWVRLITDVPTAFVEILGRRLNLRPYIQSLTSSNIESVFSNSDPFPGLAEMALLPYLSVKRGL
jgi:predicted ATP-grasp superfamily ATP-dependent carboligase